MNSFLKKLPENCVYDELDSPVGKLQLIASDRTLHAVLMNEGETIAARFAKSTGNTVIRETKRQLREYFAGRRLNFDLPISFVGTEFQRKAWNQLLRIPYGRTISYGEQAKRAGFPKSARAIGMANSLNPLGIVVPCHRVVGKNGDLTGYAGGLSKKKFLLSLEKTVRN